MAYEHESAVKLALEAGKDLVMIIDINNPLYYSKDLIPVEKYKEGQHPVSSYEIGMLSGVHVVALPYWAELGTDPVTVPKGPSTSQVCGGVVPSPELLDNKYD